MTQRQPRKAWIHLAELGAIVLVATTVTIAVYAWVFPAMAIVTPYGIAISVLLAAGFAFRRIYPRHGLVPALCSALVVATLSAGLSLFGLLNILGLNGGWRASVDRLHPEDPLRAPAECGHRPAAVIPAAQRTGGSTATRERRSSSSRRTSAACRSFERMMELP